MLLFRLLLLLLGFSVRPVKFEQKGFVLGCQTPRATKRRRYGGSGLRGKVQKHGGFVVDNLPNLELCFSASECLFVTCSSPLDQSV